MVQTLQIKPKRTGHFCSSSSARDCSSGILFDSFIDAARCNDHSHGKVSPPGGTVKSSIFRLLLAMKYRERLRPGFNLANRLEIEEATRALPLQVLTSQPES